MAYENRNAAYDLSLFDQASAAPLPKRDEEVEKVKGILEKKVHILV